ncbi:alpha/beta fold hydrolase [Streptosporangium sandarakinum]
MTPPTIGRLRVDGATLHYEVRGEGPLLLLIPGGTGGAASFDDVADDLAADRTVVSYDPRGLSRSPLDDPEAPQHVARHADDALRLLDLLSPEAPARVAGCSSGGIVALHLLATRPERVERVVAHEPPVVEVLSHATPGTDRLLPLLDAGERATAIARGGAGFVDGGPYGIPHVLRVRVLSADQGRTVIAARPFSEVQTSVNTAAHVLLVGTPLLLVLLAGVSWVIVGGTLRPIAALRRGAEEITDTARSRRLPVPESRDEVHSLAVTLNDMLARLEKADARQRALVSDAAHELRSPLASIRLQLEVALGHPEGQDWRETAEGVLEDTMRLARLAEDLLALARLDERGGALARREPVELDRLVPQTVERYGEAVTVRVAPTPGDAIVVTGDALDLGRVLVNLVDNALRHTVSPVVVELRTEGTGAVLTVTDDGSGIPEADRERVFDRFTRLDSARSRDHGGAGLGLAIVRETVHAHGGAVTLEDAAPGLRAVVRLPLS